MRSRPVGEYVFFIVGVFICGILSLLSIPSGLTTVSYLMGAGIALFALLFSIVLSLTVDALRDWFFLLHAFVAVLLLALCPFTTSTWSSWSGYSHLWIGLSGAVFFDLKSWKKSLFNIGFTAVALALSFIPNLLWVAYLIVAINGFAYCFLGQTTSSRFFAFYVSAISLASMVSCLPRLEGIRFGSFIPLLAMAFGCIWPQVVDLLRIKRENDAVIASETQIALVEEKAFKEEIRPHFLLNVLNNARVAYHENIDQGHELMTALIELESLVSSTSSLDYIPISKEIEIIKGLVHLFSLERKKQIPLNVDLQNPELLIPPLLIEPLVENSLQHSGVLNQDDGLITISQRYEFGYATITVSDNGLGQPLPSQSRGIGLSNVMKRVGILPSGHTNIESGPFGTQVEIRFQA